MEVDKRYIGDVLKITAVGAIDESVDLLNFTLADNTKSIIFHCPGVKRINSVGVKNLMSFVRVNKEKGVNISFSGCSTAVVSVINMACTFFSKNVKVNSVSVPFECEKCKKEHTRIVLVEKIKQSNFIISDEQCSCGHGSAKFSDDPNEYFRFLMSR